MILTHEVHVHLLVRDESLAGRYWGVLSESERARADRIRIGRERGRFIVGRGLLRGLLGEYLGEDPARLVFEVNAHGKPSLSGEHAWLSFNVAHSRDRIAIAFARERDLGIDIEPIAVDRELDRLAERFFAAGEVAVYLALPPDRRPSGFFRAWTLKEAYIKLKGKGLAIPLDRFEVALDPASPPALLSSMDSPEDSTHIVAHSLNDHLPNGWAGSIMVARGAGVSVKIMEKN